MADDARERLAEAEAGGDAGVEARAEGTEPAGSAGEAQPAGESETAGGRAGETEPAGSEPAGEDTVGEPPEAIAAMDEAKQAELEASAAATEAAEPGSRHARTATPDEQIPVDEEVYRMKSHRRKGESKAAEPQEKTRRRRRPAARDEPTPEQEEPEAPVEEEDPAARERRELEERIDAALKPGSKRRKRLAGDDLEMLQDDAVAKLRDAMREAALLDVECIRKGEPAVHKMKMLPEVQEVLQKRALADSILDGNLLESVRIWLEPLPDASLPSFEIQKTMFNALVNLPIKTIHLRESGLGRVVLFYQKSKRPQPVVKRMAQKLVGDWTRPIIGRSDNYRDRMVQQVDFDPDSAPAALSRKSSRPLSSYEESAARRNRAALPSANGVSYQVAPVSAAAVSQQSQGSSRSSTADSQLRRMKTKLTMNRSRSRKNQVSVEGKGLNTG